MGSLTATFSSMPMDWVGIGLIAAILIVLTLRSGTAIATALALSLPLTHFIINALPETAFLSGLASGSSLIVDLVMLGVVFVVSYLLVQRMLGQYSLGGVAPLKAILCGIAATIVLIIFWLEFPSLSNLWHFGAHVQSLFGPAYRVWWLLVSYLALAFARG